MGMYNEVYCRCPRCRTRVVKQIRQIELGFGGFNIDDHDDLTDRSLETLQELYDTLTMDDGFNCQACGHFFYALNRSRNEAKEILISKLMG